MGKAFNFKPLTLEQSRQLVDTRQAYEVLLQARADLRGRYAGTLLWKTRNGEEYLYRRQKISDRSIGRRSPETEAVLASFEQGKAAAEARNKELRGKLAMMAPVSTGMGLGRVPRIVARIVRRLDEVGLGAPVTCLVGTNALFAYEAAAGVQLESSMLATQDMDLAFDARRSLTLATKASTRGLMAVLRDVDHSFTPLNQGDYRATNKQAFMVEVIEPRRRSMSAKAAARSYAPMTGDEELSAAELHKLEWIVEAPRMTVITVAEDGLPVSLHVPDPRWFAAHKAWLSQQNDRDPTKRRRDLQQAEAVAELIATRLPGMDLDDRALASLPVSARAWLRTACESADPVDVEW